MNIITIPCAPLTRKILLAEYGPSEPIHLGARNLLYRQMCYKVDETPWLERHQQLLTTVIDIKVNKHLWSQVRQEPHQVGYHLYELHKERMFTWVAGKVGLDFQGKVEAHKKQLYAIRDYLEMYNIEEDEFSLATAERLWKRYKQKVLLFTPSTVLENETLFSIKLSSSQAVKIADRIVNLIPVVRSDFHKGSLNTIRPYVLYKYTEMTQKEVGGMLNKHRQHITRAVKNGQVALFNYPELQSVIDYCLLTFEPKSMP